MIQDVIQIAGLFLLPIIIHNVLKGKAISQWLSPVVVCFILGICAGTFLEHSINHSISKTVEETSVLIAIPLLMMTSNFIRWLPKAKPVLFSFMISCISVLIAVTVTFAVFKGQSEHAWLISSMLLAGFTGTIANANAVGDALNCPEDVQLLVNIGDMLTGAIYLIFLTSVAHPVLSRILPAYKRLTAVEEVGNDPAASGASAQNEEEDFSYLSSYQMKRFGIYIAPLIISALILGVTIGLEMLLMPAEGIDGTFVLLSVTILGILSSGVRPIRELKSSYTIGQYLLLVFCIALGSNINFSEMLSSSPLILSYVVMVMTLVLTLNIGLAYLFKIDADTMIITSTSTIFGPAFIGQVAIAMKNREVIFSGMIASMVGIALGNFLGIGLSGILKALM